MSCKISELCNSFFLTNSCINYKWHISPPPSIMRMYTNYTQTETNFSDAHRNLAVIKHQKYTRWYSKYLRLKAIDVVPSLKQLVNEKFILIKHTLFVYFRGFYVNLNTNFFYVISLSKLRFSKKRVHFV